MASRVINTILTLNDRMSRPLMRVAANTREVQRQASRANNAIKKFGNDAMNSIDQLVKRTAQLGAVAAGFAVRAIIKQSDAYSGVQARLKLINDGQQTVAEFNEKIFKSADEARVRYEDISATVAKLGIVANDAFKNNDEILRFSELLAKSFKIGGASAEEQSAAMYQLTQAMGAGRLQGDEFRSIMENAPTLAQAIAKEMGVTVGQLKDLSREGEITSDIIKRAMFNSADDINEKFGQMPMRFSEAADKIRNKITEKLQPTFEKLSKWINSKEGTDAINTIGDGIAEMAAHAPEAIDAVKRIIETVIENREPISNAIKLFAGFYIGVKIFRAIAAVIGAAKIALLIFTGVLEMTPIGWAITGISLLIAWCLIYPEKVQAMADRIAEMFTKLKERVTENWQKLKDFFKDPIKATVEYIKKGDERAKEQHEKGQAWLQGVEKANGRSALGTPYWKGGWTSINEQGPEIVHLPNGSKVIPADKTRNILGGRGTTVGKIVIYAKGVTADEVAQEILPKLTTALANM